MALASSRAIALVLNLNFAWAGGAALLVRDRSKKAAYAH
jgi:hypothetical protein